MTAFPKIHHVDHNITPEQLDYIQNHADFHLDDTVFGTFVKTVIEMPSSLGTLPGALYGPSVGDDPVTKDQVHYQRRGDRDKKSRMIDAPCRPTNKVVVMGIVGEIAFTMYGTRGSGPSPREPWDKSLKTEEEIQESVSFWKVHALSSQENMETVS